MDKILQIDTINQYDTLYGQESLHPLGKHIDNYTFFSYEAREALHLSEKERKLVVRIQLLC